MKRLSVLSLLTLVLGIGLAVLPFHVEFTGYVLILLGLGGILRRFLKGGWKKALTVAMLTASGLLLAAMVVIFIGGSVATPLPQSDYAVILGAQTYGSQPAPILRERLDAGLVYMQSHPQTTVILTGGQGPDEAQPEAEVMYAYMVAQGAEPSRLRTETKSSNTWENLQNARAMLDGDRITIITSEFHQCRAQYLAGKLGFEVGGVPSRTEDAFFLVNYCLRECFSFVKAFAA